MFFEEARLAARLNHPNIVQTYEVGSEGNRHLSSWTTCAAGRSRGCSGGNRPTSPSEQLRVFCDVLQALHYAHALSEFDGESIGIVHRDVNPQNVFVTFDGQAKLVDFGIAKAFDSQLETHVGILKGKPAYMAPEQLSGLVDARADLFAVGAMLWEAVAGRRLWAGKSEVEILTILRYVVKSRGCPKRRRARRARSLPFARRRWLPSADRYATAELFLRDLELYARDANENATAREISVVVSKTFGKEHEEARAAIERRIRDFKSGEVAHRTLSSPHLVLEVTPSGPSLFSSWRGSSSSIPSGGAAFVAPIPMRRPPRLFLCVAGIALMFGRS